MVRPRTASHSTLAPLRCRNPPAFCCSHCRWASSCCSPRWGHGQDLLGLNETGGRRTRPDFRLATTALPLPSVLSFRRGDRLPLHVRNRVGSAAVERPDMVFDVAGTGPGRASSRRARMQPLKFVLYRLRPIFARRCEGWRQRDIARQRGEKESAAQRHDRESASPSVNTATARAPEVGWWGHSRVRMNTIAKSETTTARLQKVCMALIAGSGECLDQGDGRNRPAEHPQHCGAPYLVPGRQLTEPLMALARLR